MEKPTVTEEYINSILELGLWTPEGEEYIRSSLLGKKMIFAEIDDFMKAIPEEHPEYLLASAESTENAEEYSEN